MIICILVLLIILLIVILTIFKKKSKTDDKLTIITGILDLGRDKLNGFGRPFSFYEERFKNVLKLDLPMVIYISRKSKHLVKERNPKKTKVIYIELEDLDKLPFINLIEKIRNNPKWYNQADWLSQSPQAKLKYYNPLIMSKLFWMHDTAITNPFNTKYFLWLDGGITNTVPLHQINYPKFEQNIIPYLNRFLLLTFNYTSNTEVHGFERKAMAKYAHTDFIKYVARATAFGGNVDTIKKIIPLYKELIYKTLTEGYLGTEESIYTLLCYLYPNLINRYKLPHAGCAPFFEFIKKSN